MKIQEIPHPALCTLPTPLVEASRLSAELGGPLILIKRDDLTGIAMGGNKNRGLELVLAEDKNDGVDVVLAAGPQQSNWLCSMTALARKLGIDIILFLLGDRDEIQGNVLLNMLLGAEVIFTGKDLHDLPAVFEQMENEAAKLRRQGKRPHVFDYGAMGPLGIAGYVSLAIEVSEQLKQKQLTAQYLLKL
ncbi:pyridoxal-phosphate dependent enzyme [Chloroflexota bacterium]